MEGIPKTQREGRPDPRTADTLTPSLPSITTKYTLLSGGKAQAEASSEQSKPASRSASAPSQVCSALSTTTHLTRVLHLVFPSATLNCVICLPLSNTERKTVPRLSGMPGAALLPALTQWSASFTGEGEVLYGPWSRNAAAHLGCNAQHDQRVPDAMVLMWACIWLGACFYI
jgi:hypothetical protein